MPDEPPAEDNVDEATDGEATNESEDDDFDEAALEAAEKARQQKNARSKVKEFLERRPPREIFDQFDKDGSGSIDFAEFCEMLPSIGIKMNEAKAKTFFRACDQDFSGSIDFEEFKLALHASDGAAGNSLGFVPKDYIGPHDAFEMFDEDFSEALNEDEFAVALEYLGLTVDGGKQERLFMQHDLDASGSIEYNEFRTIWLKLVNPREELKKRGIPVPRWAFTSTLREALEDVVRKEDSMQEHALAEADHWYMWNLDLRRRRNAIRRAYERYEDELQSALNLGGQVFMFGTGASGQFMSAPVVHQHSYIAPVGRYNGINENRRYIKDVEGKPVSKKVPIDKRLWDVRAGKRIRITRQTMENLRKEQEELISVGYGTEDRELSRIANLWIRKCCGIMKIPRFARQPNVIAEELANDPPDPYKEESDEEDEEDELKSDSESESSDDSDAGTNTTYSGSPSKRRLRGRVDLEEEDEVHYFDKLKPSIREKSSFFTPGLTDVSKFKYCMANYSTAGLWCRRIMSVSVGGNIAYALSDTGEIFAWGGQHKWSVVNPSEKNLNTVVTEEDDVDEEEEKKKEEDAKAKRSFNWIATDETPGDVTERSKHLKGYSRIARTNAYDTTRRKRRQKYVYHTVDQIEAGPTKESLEELKSNRSNKSIISTGHRSYDTNVMDIEEELNKLEEDVYTDLREKQCHEIEVTTKYFEVWEPSPSTTVRHEFYTKVLLPKLNMEEIDIAFSIRGVGFDFKHKNKIEICERFCNMLQLERKFLAKGREALGLRMSQRFRDLEKEWKKLSGNELVVNKRKKMLEIGTECFIKWAPIRAVQDRVEMERNDKHLEAIKNQKAREENEYMMWREKLSQAKEDSSQIVTARGKSLEVLIGGITARGPEELTPRSNYCIAISAGNAHSMLILGNGELYTWGSGTYGRLGQSSPPAYKWTGQKRKTPAEVKRLQEQVYQQKTQADLDALLKTPEYDLTPSLINPRTGFVPSHAELAKREFERERFLGNIKDDHPMVKHMKIEQERKAREEKSAEREKKKNAKPLSLLEMGSMPPPIVQIPKLELSSINSTTRNEEFQIPGLEDKKQSTGFSATNRNKRNEAHDKNNLMGEMEHGRSGYWEKLYRGNDREDLDHPTVVEGLRPHPLQHISAGFNHSIAVTFNGEVMVWGDCSCGKLGIGETLWEKEGYTCYIPMPWHLPLPTRIRKVSAGFAHSVFVGEKGEVYVCGTNDGGRLGIGTKHVGKSILSPKLVECMSNHTVVDVSCGACHTLLRTELKTVMEGVGFRAEKKLVGGALFQAGSAWAFSGLPIHEFELVKGDLHGIPCVDMSAGTAHSAAVTHQGEVYTWGGNRNGGAGHPVDVISLESPTLVECLYTKPKNLAIGKEVKQSSTYTVGVKSWHKPELASNGDIRGEGEKYCTHTTRDSQGWWEVDLGAVAVLEKIVFWNRTDEPVDRGQPRDYFTRRMFPCWVMISTEALPDEREDGLEEALDAADCARRFDENVRCTEWTVPVNTTGRYVRIQLEKKNFLHFAQLEVYGTWGRAAYPVSAVECGRDVTVAIVHPSMVARDLEEAYLKCVKADPHSAILLRQYETYQPYYEKYGDGRNIKGKCILCNAMSNSSMKCEICTLYETWPKSIAKGDELYGKNRQKTLFEVADLLMNENMEPLKWVEPWYPPRRGCKQTIYGMHARWQRYREGGRQPSWAEVAEHAALQDATSGEVFDRYQDKYNDDESSFDDEDD